VQPLIDIQPLTVPYKNTQLQGERWRVDGQRAEALILHGGGSSQGSGFQPLRNFLAAHGIGSTTLDFIGHGRTGGALADSSLADRVAQVLALMDDLPLDAPSTALIGFSMGAYVAAQVSARRPIRNLGLAIPAAYAPAAFELPFGPQFSACIRQPGSWQDSDAFQIMRAYTGRLLVLSAAEDQVIPAEIPARLFDEARHARQRVHHSIAGATHQLSEQFAREPQSQVEAYRQIVALMEQP
jgi:pimeloyl-ACP methyl ester carboxylesterase